MPSLNVHLITANVPTRANHVFSIKVLQSIVETWKHSAFDSTIYGQIASSFNDFERFERFEINLKNVSHKVDELFIRNNDLWATINILPTEKGNVLYSLIASDLKLERIKFWPVGEGIANTKEDETLEIMQYQLTAVNAYVLPNKINILLSIRKALQKQEIPKKQETIIADNPSKFIIPNVKTPYPDIKRVFLDHHLYICPIESQ